MQPTHPSNMEAFILSLIQNVVSLQANTLTECWWETSLPSRVIVSSTKSAIVQIPLKSISLVGTFFFGSAFLGAALATGLAGSWACWGAATGSCPLFDEKKADAPDPACLPVHYQQVSLRSMRNLAMAEAKSLNELYQSDSVSLFLRRTLFPGILYSSIEPPKPSSNVAASPKNGQLKIEKPKMAT